MLHLDRAALCFGGDRDAPIEGSFEMTKLTRLCSIPAIVAALGLATPASAVVLPAPAAATSAAHGVANVQDGNVAGWDRYRRYRHRRGSDAGDILAGVIVLGGALAIASAIKSKREDERYRDNYPQPDPNYRPERRDERYDAYPNRYDDNRRGINGAIEQCVGEVERDNRVGTVDDASRGADGWVIEGDLYEGGRYRCEIDNAGRIRDLDVELTRARYGVAPAAPNYGGRDDDYYADARARQGVGDPDERNWDEVPAQDGWSDEAPEYAEPVEAAPAEDGEQRWRRGEQDDRYQTSDSAVVAMAH